MIENDTIGRADSCKCALCPPERAYESIDESFLVVRNSD